jgi:hypothetical protein
MNQTEASDILVKHSEFFELFFKVMYVPRAAEMIVAEINAAYKILNPGYTPCSGCNDSEWVIDANRYRVTRIKELENNTLKAMTFPKYKK